MNIQNPFTDEQVRTFYREGYLVAPGLVRAGSIDQVLQEVSKVPVAVGGSWTPFIFEHNNPMKDAAYHRLLVEPNVVGAAQQLLEAPARVYYGMVAVVPGKGGKGLEWHQDNQYDYVLGRALNVFIALCDITPDMAILWVAPKSHLSGVQPSELVNGHRKNAYEPENGMPLPGLKKGDACIFDRNTLHRSLTNTTEKHRYAYASQYTEVKSRNSKTGDYDHHAMLATDLHRLWQQAGIVK